MNLLALEVVAHVHQLRLDKASLLRQYGLDSPHLEDKQWQRLAKAVGFRLRRKRLDPQAVLKRYDLPVVNLPTYEVVLKQLGDEQVLVFNPESKQSKVKPIASLQGEWWVLTPRLAQRFERFGLSWFFKEIIQYKQLLVEILLGSFVLQIFGLATPLLTQVILDKVLGHQAFSTLTVLAVGFVALAVFELLFSWCRQYLTVHTASKLDVRLGVKVFRQLFSLPFSFFEHRRVGDTLSRVRELEQIRSFLSQRSITVIFRCAVFGCLSGPDALLLPSANGAGGWLCAPHCHCLCHSDAYFSQKAASQDGVGGDEPKLFGGSVDGDSNGQSLSD